MPVSLLGTWFNIMGMCMIHHLGGMLMGTESMKTEPRDSIFWSTFLGWFLLILQFAVLSTLKWKVHKHMTLMGARLPDDSCLTIFRKKP